jgi:hypothetical protein
MMIDRVHACSVNFWILDGEETFPLEVPLCMSLVALYVDSGNGKDTEFRKEERLRETCCKMPFSRELKGYSLLKAIHPVSVIN